MRGGFRKPCRAAAALPAPRTAMQMSRLPVFPSQRSSHSHSFTNLSTKFVRHCKPRISTKNHTQNQISESGHREKQGLEKSLTQNVSEITNRALKPEVKQYPDALDSFSSITSTPKRRIKCLKHSVSKPIPVNSSETNLTMDAKKNSVKVTPVLRIFNVDSEDLMEDKSEVDEVITHLREKNRSRRLSKDTTRLLSPNQSVNSPCYSIKIAYCEDTAQVLSDTRILAQRRSSRNVLPGRLFRHIPRHSLS